jgi:hypothetical protein
MQESSPCTKKLFADLPTEKSILILQIEGVGTISKHTNLNK